MKYTKKGNKYVFTIDQREVTVSYSNDLADGFPSIMCHTSIRINPELLFSYSVPSSEPEINPEQELERLYNQCLEKAKGNESAKKYFIN